MRILMLLQHPFPPDIRVENEAASLLAAGHEVHLLCSEDRRGAVELPSTLDGLVVHTVPATWEQLGSWKRRFMNLPLLWFINVYWLREIAALDRREGRFDVIHVHDLPLVRTGRWAARRIGASVVADLHENYPMALQAYITGKSYSWIGRYRRSQRRWERYERRSVPSCAAIVATADEMKARLMSVGISPDRITVVENFVDVDRFLSYPIDQAFIAGLRERYVITYVGGFGVLRGLDTAITAMKRVVAVVPEALLVLVGDGAIKGELEALTKELSLDDHVRFEAWVDLSRVPSYIAASDVCILPLVQSVQTDAGLAHKLFQYMLIGKPVVASSCLGSRRVVADAECGLLFPPGDSGALADALIRLTDAELGAQLGERGRVAVLDRYNWKVAGQRLLGLYEGLQPPAKSVVEELSTQA